MKKGNDNPVLRMTFQFSLQIMEYCDELENQRKWVFANQLLKAGTSIGANVREAQNAESKADFIHKFKIAAKEADETKYFLELCSQAKNYPSPGNLVSALDEIQKVLNKIIATSKGGSN